MDDGSRPHRFMGENRAPVLEMTTQRRTPMLRTLLSGGDRRSIGRSNRALELIRANPSRVSAIAELAQDADWLIAMRAVDLLEKLARQNPEWVEPHKRIFLGALADSDKWEIRLQVVRALALFGWTPTHLRLQLRERNVEVLGNVHGRHELPEVLEAAGVRLEHH